MYQTWPRIAKYMPLCEPLFKKYSRDKKVLEIGCNCGLYGLEMLKYIDYYIGVDKSAKMCSNAAKALVSEQKKNWTILNMSPASWELPIFLTWPGICFFDMMTMYCYRDADVRGFEDSILPCIGTAIIVMKEYKRPPGRLYNSYGYHKSAVVVERLATRGMRLVEDIYANKHKNRAMVFKR